MQTLTHRERWNRTFHFQTVDHVPDFEFGYWPETLDRWHQEGLPAEITYDQIADKYFGFAPGDGVPLNVGLLPGFESKTVEEKDGVRTVQDGDGVLYQQYIAGPGTIPHYLRFPLESRADWQKFKRRLDPHHPDRKVNVAELQKKWEHRDYPVTIFLGSMFGWIRNWMGFERAAMTCFDDPAWIEEMVDHIADLVYQTIEPVVSAIQFDSACFWEDIAFRNGPMISPKMFARFLVPRYKRITDLLRHNGCDVIYVDCDGNINVVVEEWLKGGVNCMFPIEIAAGSDPQSWRDRFGQEVLLMGGVDKRALAAGKQEIEQEIKRLEPLVAQGGYAPHVDHRVPPDVSYENYLYYLHVKRTALGIPEPERRVP